jgi:ABC-type Fe3+-siderophore transport system permease subunit
MPQDNQQSNVLPNVLGVIVGVPFGAAVSMFILETMRNDWPEDDFYNFACLAQLCIMFFAILINYGKGEHAKFLSPLLYFFSTQSVSSVIVFQVFKNLTFSW